jgi:hypothetical protein
MELQLLSPLAPLAMDTARVGARPPSRQNYTLRGTLVERFLHRQTTLPELYKPEDGVRLEPGECRFDRSAGRTPGRHSLIAEDIEMMNTLLFKLATFVFLSGSAVAAFLYSQGPCANKGHCPYASKAAVTSTVAQTAEPAAMSDHCAKYRAAMSHECKRTAAMASHCPHSRASVAVAQASEPEKSAPAETTANQ